MSEQDQEVAAVPEKGWILYDDSCGFCRRWAPFWEEPLRRRGFAIAPLQADWVRESLAMPVEELLKDIRLLLRDGRLLSGPEAYRHALRCIGWARPLYWLSVVPGIRILFDRGYRWVASHRHVISQACGLPPGV